jgi:hypothetical protein
VVDQPPHRSQRVQGIPPEEVPINSLPPPQRHRLDPTDTFEPVSPVDFVEIEDVETNSFAPEVTHISYLKAEGFILSI